jgi:hypothetical protein
MDTAFYSVQGKVTKNLILELNKMDGITSVNLVEL